MAKPKGITVKGVRETEQAFEKLRDDIGDMSAVYERVMRNRIPGVRDLTPILSGTLRDSWDALGSTESGSIISKVSYAPFVEYGAPSRSVAPVGMVHRTLVAEQKATEQEIKKAIEDLAKKRGFRVD